MTTTQRASARSAAVRADQALLEAVEHHVASTAITGTIKALRTTGFGDAYIAAAMLAGVKTLVHGLPDNAPFAALLAAMAEEVTNG